MDAQEMTGILSALLASGAVKPRYVAGLELAAALMAGTVGEVTFDAEEAEEEESEEEAEEMDADAEAEEEAARGPFRFGVRRQSDGAWVMRVGKTSKWTRDESCAASWDNTRGARVSAGRHSERNAGLIEVFDNATGLTCFFYEGGHLAMP